MVNIVEADSIYQMVEKHKWECIMGKDRLIPHAYNALEILLSDSQKKESFIGKDVDFISSMNMAGNLFLVFESAGISTRYFTMNEYSAKWHYWKKLKLQEKKYAKVKTLPQDITWLCRNKKLLIKLSKGELKPDEYRFTLHEFSMIMYFAPSEWRSHLVSYAIQDKNPLYANHSLESKFMPYLNLLIEGVKGDSDTLRKYSYLQNTDLLGSYYPLLLTIARNEYDATLTNDLRNYRDKLEKKIQLQRRDKIFASAVLGDENLNDSILNSFVELRQLRKYIIQHNDTELLKAYMKRVERRQSLADVLSLGQFLQSGLYLKGSSEVRHIILDQCALRKEKEIVWQLADSLQLVVPEKKDEKPELISPNPKERARAIMMKFTGKDLGDDPAVWKKWYRDQ